MPKVEKLDFGYDQLGYDLIIVNTGKGHADLSAEYSSVPIEMKKAAQVMGKEVLADVDEKEFMQMNKVRKEAGRQSCYARTAFLRGAEPCGCCSESNQRKGLRYLFTVHHQIR